MDSTEHDEIHDVEPQVSPGEERDARFRRRNFARPAVDITATDSEVVVIADLPGVQKADLGITIDRDELVIEAPVAGRADRESSLPWGFYRRFRLRTLVDRDRIGAHLEGGVARVVLPKSAAEKAKKVAVD